MATVQIDSLEQERQYYQAKIDLCFKMMRSRAGALVATERLRRLTTLLKQASISPLGVKGG
jgi:hypothetical protein